VLWVGDHDVTRLVEVSTFDLPGFEPVPGGPVLDPVPLSVLRQLHTLDSATRRECSTNNHVI